MKIAYDEIVPMAKAVLRDPASVEIEVGSGEGFHKAILVENLPLHQAISEAMLGLAIGEIGAIATLICAIGQIYDDQSDEMRRQIRDRIGEVLPSDTRERLEKILDYARATFIEHKK